MIKLVTQPEIDSEKVADFARWLSGQVEQGRVTQLVAAVAYLDENGHERHELTYLGCSGFQAIGLHEFAKASILEAAFAQDRE